MANYSLVVNSKFRPFEYQELMAPVLMATQAHQALEDTYSELGTKASVFDKMANETTDPKAYSIYKKYSDDLNAQAEQLSKYGLNPTSRQNMMNMRARYAKDIIPIETAYKKREADAKAQAEMMMKDPTHFFNRQASNISLDEYMANPMLDVLSTNYSGALLQQQVSQAAAALKNTIMKKGAITSLGLPYQYERALQKGATPDEVLAAMAKDPNALPILNKLVDDTMAASGIRNWSSMNGDWVNNPMYQRAEAYARQGLMSAIGTTDYQAFKDDAGLARLHADLQDRNAARQHARQVAENKRQEAVRAAQAAGAASNHTRLNPLALRSPQELSERQKKIDDYMKAGYFYKDSKGDYVMTHKGFEAMRKGKYTQDTRGWSNAFGVSMMDMQGNRAKDDNFYKFMVGLNGGKSFLEDNAKQTTKAGWGPRRAGNLFKNYVNSSQEGSYDTYHSTEYDRQLSSEYGKDLTNQLWSAAGTRKGSKVLETVEFNGKNGWKTNDMLTSDKLKGYTATNIRYSKWGTTAILQKDGEEPIRVRVPAGINTTVESRVGAAIGNADDYGLILSKGLQPKTVVVNGELRLDRDKKGNIKFSNTPLTTNDIVVFSQYQRDALDEMNTSGSQLVVGSKTKDEEYGNFNY